MEKKYEFTGETKYYYGTELKRIVAVKDFGDVKKGDLGGWIEKESNLSHEGECWVFDEAMVYENASVSEDASVGGEAKVSGRAEIKGQSQVCGRAEIKDYAKIYDNALVWGNSQVHGNSEVFGYAVVNGKARVNGKVKVFGKSLITDDVIVSGNALVYEEALVNGYARICGEGEVLTKRVITINHPLHNVTITDTHITIGCQSHPKSFWKNATYKDVLEMVGAESAKHWVEFKPHILKIADVPSKTFTINFPFCNKKLIISG